MEDTNWLGHALMLAAVLGMLGAMGFFKND